MGLFILLIWLGFAMAAGAAAADKGRSAAAWLALGLLFGPIVLLILACLPDEPTHHHDAATLRDRGNEPVRTRRAAPIATPARPDPRSPFFALSDLERARWEHLKGLDPEIAAAAARMAALGDRFESELAHGVLLAGHPHYLAAVGAKVSEHARSLVAEHGEIAALVGPELANEATRELEEYRSYLAENGGNDRGMPSPVANVAVYAGRWVFARGGIRITLADGRTVLRKGATQRFFPPGEIVP